MSGDYVILETRPLTIRWAPEWSWKFDGVGEYIEVAHTIEGVRLTAKSRRSSADAFRNLRRKFTRRGISVGG